MRDCRIRYGKLFLCPYLYGSKNKLKIEAAICIVCCKLRLCCLLLTALFVSEDSVMCRLRGA